MLQVSRSSLGNRAEKEARRSGKVLKASLKLTVGERETGAFALNFSEFIMPLSAIRGTLPPRCCKK